MNLTPCARDGVCHNEGRACKKEFRLAGESDFKPLELVLLAVIFSLFIGFFAGYFWLDFCKFTDGALANVQWPDMRWWE